MCSPPAPVRRFAASGTYRLSVLVNKKLVTGARYGPITVYETEGSTEVEDDSDDCRQPISCSDHGTPKGCLCACDPGWTHSQDVSQAQCVPELFAAFHTEPIERAGVGCA
jgi:hypothetical protein